MKKLNSAFFNRKTALVAQELLGKVLVYESEQGTLSGIIVETEAYIGPKDLASHASRGKTIRNAPMFGEAGVWYVYLIYGFYHCLNIVTEEKSYPAAVLIRAIEPLGGISTMQFNRRNIKIENLASGPGKLCQAFGIDKKINYTSAINKKSPLFIGDIGLKIENNKIIKTKRIGVDYAGIWKNRLLRFYIKDNLFISKK
jgi:DNA-3-methyladenine glycosylase